MLKYEDTMTKIEHLLLGRLNALLYLLLLTFMLWQVRDITQYASFIVTGITVMLSLYLMQLNTFFTPKVQLIVMLSQTAVSLLYIADKPEIVANIAVGLTYTCMIANLVVRNTPYKAFLGISISVLGCVTCPYQMPAILALGLLLCFFIFRIKWLQIILRRFLFIPLIILILNLLITENGCVYAFPSLFITLVIYYQFYNRRRMLPEWLSA